jgi:hypothetical protein
MNPLLKKFVQKPILLLVALNVLIGLFTFKDYGTAWDEPLFYSYGDALGYAYSPREWFSGDFDLYNSYGASGDDHKNRGPAYLFLARNFVHGLQALGSDSTEAWHLVNFLFFQFGIYFIYRISKRWMGDSSALFTAVLFSLQPLLWGHAFINPKDPPFMTFFLASVCYGFEMVDAVALDARDKTRKILLASFLLGIAASIRVLGPFAGLLVVLYSIGKSIKTNLRVSASPWLKTHSPSIIRYAIFSILVMFLTWPYLWENPLRNFIDVFRFMSDNPTQLAVLFGGDIYRAGELPIRYMPFMLATTLTEPVVPLFLGGILLGFWSLIRSRDEARRDQLVSLSLVLLWFLALVAYVLLRRPSMYDGIRHFLFILPPVFIFAGMTFESLLNMMRKWINSPIWLRAGIGLFLVLPGIYGLVRLHPYQYTYYNFYIGGTSGAFRSYETDYWLTCYKDAVEELNNQISTPVNLFVKREAYIAAPYAQENIRIRDLREESDAPRSGDYILVNSRVNDDLYTFPNAPSVIEISRLGAKFCVIKQIP